MRELHYIQDSLSLRIDGERIPSVVPVPETPKPRAPKRRLQDAKSHGIPELKRCRACNEVKHSSEFTLCSSSRDGLWFRCAECQRQWVRDRYHNSTPEEVNRRRNRHIEYTYGITLEARNAMLDAQGGGCAICGGESNSKGWHIDHDHETGAIRGILCNGCNTAIGQMKDNPDTLIAAAKYLWKRGK